MWFESLMGFSEKPIEQVRQNISIQKNMLKSLCNGKVFTCGRLEIPSLAELKKQIQTLTPIHGTLTLREVVADVQQLHTDPSNAGALFQVASQFNLLEMISPEVTPEQGISDYELDKTQGPACAIAAGAGTIYRNYFVPINGHIGQSSTHQIDGLADLGAAWNNADEHLWHMKNGYALTSRQGLQTIQTKLEAAHDTELNAWRQLLRIGVQWNTQVTLNDCKHTVSQAYCSALPVAYSGLPSQLWSAFAQFILHAAYESTFCAGILNAQKTGNKTLYLTLLGGGAFGNEKKWILSAIQRAITLYQKVDLDVVIVSHGYSDPDVQYLIQKTMKC